MASTTKATGQRNDMSDLLHDGIAEYISGRFYERKLIDDAWRGTYAECLVYSALRGSFLKPAGDHPVKGSRGIWKTTIASISR